MPGVFVYNEIITEAFSGKTMVRPQFLCLLEKLICGDTLIVCELDGFARTAVEGVQTVRQAEYWGINNIQRLARTINEKEHA